MPEGLKRRLRNILIGYFMNQGYPDDSTFFMYTKRLPQSWTRRISKLGKRTIKIIKSTSKLGWVRSSTSSPSISVRGWSEKTSSHFHRNCTGIHRIPPLRSLSHIKRRDLRGSETAAKGALDQRRSISIVKLEQTWFESSRSNQFFFAAI